MAGMDRRKFLKAGAAAGALLVARPVIPPVLAGSDNGASNGVSPGADHFPTSRSSRLFRDGTTVVHSDMHNHSLLSDGAGDPDAAFQLMRDSGLDVASLTDHAILGKEHAHITCPSGPCTQAVGINRDSWERMGDLADDADDPGQFVAIRGFEWTSGHLGHVNVWMTENWTDPLETDGLMHPQGLANFIDNSAGTNLSPTAGAVPDFFSSMDGLYEWLQTAVEDGGGADGLAGFNHPNSWGNFEDFRFVEGADSRLVSCEIYTFATDFLFFGVPDGQPSPINACLNAGWKVGMLGVSDEHGTAYGQPGLGRGGLWVKSWTREGVFEALQARRFFATREAGLRVDVGARSRSNGGPGGSRARMGGELAHRSGSVRFAVDIAGGPDWVGRDVIVEVLRPGPELPRKVWVEYARVPDDGERVISFTVPNIDIDDGEWILLRIADPHGEADPNAPDGSRRSIAYPSPFYLVPPDES